MATFRQKHDPIRVFWRRLGLVALFVLVVMAGSGVWNVYRKDRESRLLRVQSESELAHLQQQQEQLDARISKLETPRGQEEVLRQQYAVGRHGEEMIIIVDPEQPSQAPTSTAGSSMYWLGKFFGW